MASVIIQHNLSKVSKAVHWFIIPAHQPDHTGAFLPSMNPFINPSIRFIGAGNLASSLIHGLIQKGYTASLISVSAPSRRNLDTLSERYGIQTLRVNIEQLQQADIVVLAVKPQILQSVCCEIKDSLKENALIISLAAGVRCQSIENWLAGQQPLVRCMPNTPSQIALGACGLYANERVNAEQKSLAENIMGSVGVTCWVDSEKLIDTVTAISGSGPAYFFLFMEALVEAAVENGLDKSVAEQLAIQTCLGAASLAQQSPDDLATLRRKVTSPNGTTERAIASFEANQLRATVSQAVKACAARANELAEQLAND